MFKYPSKKFFFPHFSTNIIKITDKTFFKHYFIKCLMKLK